MIKYIEQLNVILKSLNRYFILDKKELDQSTQLISMPNDLISTGFNEETHRKKLNKWLKEVTTSVKISTFIFTDEEIAQKLIKTAYRLQGGVYILTSDINRNLVVDYGYSKEDENKHIKILRLLENSPVNLRCVPGLHAKFWIFDSDNAIISSANLTQNSLSHVPELGFVIKDHKEILSLSNCFSKLWLQFATREMIQNQMRDIHNAGISNTKIVSFSKIKPFVKLKRNEFTWQINSWYDEIHDLLLNAHSEIVICSYSIDLKDTKAFDILSNKLSDGVMVKIIVARIPFVSSYSWGFRELMMDWLYEYKENFNINIHDNIHAKFIVIDGNKSFLSTKNYDRSKKYNNSFELGIRIDGYSNHLLQIYEKLYNESSEILIIENREGYLQKFSDMRGYQIWMNNLIIWIWDPQKPVYGYLGIGPDVSELRYELEKAIFVTIHKMSDELLIIRIKRNLKLYIKGLNYNQLRLVRIEENYDRIENEAIENYVLGCDKVSFHKYVEI